MTLKGLLRSFYSEFNVANAIEFDDCIKIIFQGEFFDVDKFLGYLGYRTLYDLASGGMYRFNFADVLQENSLNRGCVIKNNCSITDRSRFRFCGKQRRG